MSTPASPNDPSLANPKIDADAHAEPGDTEVVYYDGSPPITSDLGAFSLYALVGLVLIAIPFLYAFLSNGHHFPAWWLTLAFILVGLAIPLIPLIQIRSIRYRITNYRIDYERGIFSRDIDTLELWHVEDIHFHQSLFDRLAGIGVITVESRDETMPNLTLRGLPNPKPLYETLKQRVIAVKRQRGVVKVDPG